MLNYNQITPLTLLINHELEELADQGMRSGQFRTFSNLKNSDNF